MSIEDQSDITIREATNEDSDTILDLIFDIWIKEYHFEVKREDFPDLHVIENYYNKKVDGLFLVAILDNIIIGTIACNRLNQAAYVLKRMFVKKKYRGLGIAQALLDKLFNEIVYSKKNSNVEFYLSTKESHAIAAKKFYLKNNFRVISKSQLPSNFPFFYKDDLFMLRDKWQ